MPINVLPPSWPSLAMRKYPLQQHLIGEIREVRRPRGPGREEALSILLAAAKVLRSQYALSPNTGPDVFQQHSRPVPRRSTQRLIDPDVLSSFSVAAPKSANVSLTAEEKLLRKSLMEALSAPDLLTDEPESPPVASMNVQILHPCKPFESWEDPSSLALFVAAGIDSKSLGEMGALLSDAVDISLPLNVPLSVIAERLSELPKEDLFGAGAERFLRLLLLHESRSPVGVAAVLNALVSSWLAHSAPESVSSDLQKVERSEQQSALFSAREMKPELALDATSTSCNLASTAESELQIDSELEAAGAVQRGVAASASDLQPLLPSILQTLFIDASGHRRFVSSVVAAEIDALSTRHIIELLRLAAEARVQLDRSVLSIIMERLRKPLVQAPLSDKRSPVAMKRPIRSSLASYSLNSTNVLSGSLEAHFSPPRGDLTTAQAQFCSALASEIDTLAPELLAVLLARASSEKQSPAVPWHIVAEHLRQLPSTAFTAGDVDLMLCGLRPHLRSSSSGVAATVRALAPIIAGCSSAGFNSKAVIESLQQQLGSELQDMLYTKS